MLSHTIDEGPDMTNPLSHVISYVAPEPIDESGDILPFSITGLLQGAEKEHMILFSHKGELARKVQSLDHLLYS